jgi:hypothetical protein
MPKQTKCYANKQNYSRKRKHMEWFEFVGGKPRVQKFFGGKYIVGKLGEKGEIWGIAPIRVNFLFGLILILCGPDMDLNKHLSVTHIKSC